MQEGEELRFIKKKEKKGADVAAPWGFLGDVIEVDGVIADGEAESFIPFIALFDGIPFFLSTGEVDVRQRATILKCLLSNTLHASGNDDRGQCCARFKGAITNKGERIRELYGIQRCAVIKGFFFDSRYALGNHDGTQRRAILKRSLADGRQVVGQGDGCQCLTMGESTVADAEHSVGKLYGGQSRRPVKGIVINANYDLIVVHGGDDNILVCTGSLIHKQTGAVAVR